MSNAFVAHYGGVHRCAARALERGRAPRDRRQVERCEQIGALERGVWREADHVGQSQFTFRIDDYDLMIVGGGSAAFAAAIKGAELSAKVAIVEQGTNRRHLREHRLRPVEDPDQGGRAVLQVRLPALRRPDRLPAAFGLAAASSSRRTGSWRLSARASTFT